MREAIADPLIDDHGRSRLRQLLYSQHRWETDDVLAALTDNDADARRFAADEAGRLRLAAAAPILRSSLRTGRVDAQTALIAIARIEGDEARSVLFDYVDSDRHARWGCVMGLVEIGLLDDAARFIDDPDRGVSGAAIEHLGIAGHLPTIAAIERMIRADDDPDRRDFFSLRGGLARGETSPAEEAMIRLVRDHQLLPPGSMGYVNFFLAILAERGRREIEPILGDLLATQECWEAVACAAAVLKTAPMLGPLRALRYPDTPDDDWRYARAELEQWTDHLERRLSQSSIGAVEPDHQPDF